MDLAKGFSIALYVSGQKQLTIVDAGAGIDGVYEHEWTIPMSCAVPFSSSFKTPTSGSGLYTLRVADAASPSAYGSSPKLTVNPVGPSQLAKRAPLTLKN